MYGCMSNLVLNLYIPEINENPSTLLQLTYSRNTQAELGLKYMAYMDEYRCSKGFTTFFILHYEKSKRNELVNENMYYI